MIIQRNPSIDNDSCNAYSNTVDVFCWRVISTLLVFRQALHIAASWFFLSESSVTDFGSSSSIDTQRRSHLVAWDVRVCQDIAREQEWLDFDKACVDRPGVSSSQS